MKIRFFGDSWAWTWFTDSNKHLYKNILSLNDSYKDGVSLTKILLELMGHEVTLHNVPGTGPLHTKEVIKETLSNLSSVEEEYWIWQISCTLRGDTYNSFDFSSIEKFISSYDAKTLEHLQEVNDFGIPENIHICLMGAHTELPESIFNSIKNKSNNFHFMCRSIKKTLCTPDNGLNYTTPKTITSHIKDRFQFGAQKFFGDYVNSYGDDYKDYFSLEVLEFYSECYDYFAGNDVLDYPDSGHLGFSGHVLMTEYVLNFIEDLKTRNA